MIKILFIVFNLLMIAWLVSYWHDIGPLLNTGSEAEKTGAMIGATMGTFVVLFFWATGDVILAALRYFFK